MAVATSNMYYHPENKTWKIFVRETNGDCESGKTTAKYNDQLNFHGDEAKIAYETIINANNTLEKFNNAKKSKSDKKIKGLSRSLCGINEVKSKTNIYNSSKIDANKILKAVEDGDIKFLQNNLTNKNVNIVDNYGWTPLMSAAYCGNELIVEFLLKLGANKDYKNKSGLTALQLARKKDHSRSINLLTAKKLVEKNEQCQVNNYKMHEFYCSICKATFKETNVKEHEASVLHIFNTNPKLPDPIYGISPQNRGYQIMVNNGWEKSKGLGPSGSGLKYPVKTVLKRDRKGLGHKSNAQARVTHFQSGDTNAVCYTSQSNVKNNIKMYTCKRDREKLRRRERRKEIAIRHALS
ncbi:hypothetical protein PV327_002265 [Microctonus hyperodae]|uniref:G-patch domain-containing protein n=1 Tax=Microctonus hyperodae TaxID=165561 RepID=A0AA39FFM2_MICHY|nr:hypothetical protein PV327_002265 [Microctonus hyperodae]